jgi:poly-gamma-glutamate synthesis protein (capsule biosynthesis protein)
MPKIVIGGDFCPIGSNLNAAIRGDGEALFGDLRPIMAAAELTIVNLECPLIEEPSPVHKDGPTLGCDSKAINGLTAGGVNLVGLANNHTMDHGVPGLLSTIAACEKSAIAHVGAGRSLADAASMRIVAVEGLRVGIYAMAENEFGIARAAPSGGDLAGVNPLDVIEFARTMAKNKGQVDYVIVLIHGGNEYLRYPRPSLQNACRFMIECGANAIVCQHSHCIGCVESYMEGHIVYGQGNFIFDMESDYPEWYEGVLISLNVGLERTANLELIPFTQSRPSPGAHRMDERRASEAASGIHQRSRLIVSEEFVQERWQEYCRDRERHYLRRLGSPNRLIRILDRMTGWIQRSYADQKHRDEHLNILRCESHREALVQILSEHATSPGPLVCFGEFIQECVSRIRRTRKTASHAVKKAEARKHV